MVVGESSMHITEDMSISQVIYNYPTAHIILNAVENEKTHVFTMGYFLQLPVVLITGLHMFYIYGKLRFFKEKCF